jgi:hypothetical protein
LTAFPPEDICSFLRLSAGQWLALRSLMDPEDAEDAAAALENDPDPSDNAQDHAQHWHQSERAELTLVFLEPNTDNDCGGLEIALPDQSRQRLNFLRDGTFWINGLSGRWHLSVDGSLELEMNDNTKIVKERIWYSKPNLRLRCTLEQGLDGHPGRASFSSEIRRVKRPQEASQSSPY